MLLHLLRLFYFISFCFASSYLATAEKRSEKHDGFSWRDSWYCVTARFAVLLFFSLPVEICCWWIGSVLFSWPLFVTVHTRTCDLQCVTPRCPVAILRQILLNVFSTQNVSHESGVMEALMLLSFPEKRSAYNLRLCKTKNQIILFVNTGIFIFLRLDTPGRSYLIHIRNWFRQSEHSF